MMTKFFKKKRLICICLITFVWLLAAPMSVSADIGPKPSVTVTVTGLEGENYYVTLLSERDSTGPWSLGNEYYDYMGEEAAFLKFCEYEDGDGYFFLSFMEDCSEDHTFEWDYYPPSPFKILIYLPEYDRFLADDAIYERYAFDSYYTVEVSGGDTLAVTSAESILLETTESYDFSLELFSFAARVVLTILVELALAWLFGYRSKKTLSIIAYANIATQVILNILLNVINYKSGQWAFMLNYVWMELVIFGIEAAVYRKVIGSEDSATGKKYRPALYAFVANLMSFAVGMWIARVIPGIF